MTMICLNTVSLFLPHHQLYETCILFLFSKRKSTLRQSYRHLFITITSAYTVKLLISRRVHAITDHFYENENLQTSAGISSEENRNWRKRSFQSCMRN